MVASPRKPLVWIGSSKKDLIAMPEALRKEFGVALDLVQQGFTPEGAKPLKGGAAGAVQLSDDYRGGTYRAVYTIELAGVVYVLHCFQKKAKRGAETPKAEIDVIEARLKAAKALHAPSKRR